MYAGTGGDTLNGGAGNDTFHIDSTHGNDTIDGGAGHNTVDFDKLASTDINSLHTSGGETTIHFNDGQTVTVSHVENLVFTDKTEHL
jgi:Ca2+-binding RTX toxin-like protein